MAATKQPRVTKLVTKLVVKVYGKLNNWQAEMSFHDTEPT